MLVRGLRNEELNLVNLNETDSRIGWDVASLRHFETLKQKFIYRVVTILIKDLDIRIPNYFTLQPSIYVSVVCFILPT